jgi:hypothetical protein
MNSFWPYGAYGEKKIWADNVYHLCIIYAVGVWTCTILWLACHVSRAARAAARRLVEVLAVLVARVPCAFLLELLPS